MDEIFLVGCEEVLGDRVVVTDSCSPEGAQDFVTGAELRELMGCVLTGFNWWMQHRLVGATIDAR